MSDVKICSKPAAALAVSLFALAASASATVQCNSGAPMPYVVPATTAGVYLNLVTGVFSITPAGAPGWELNAWGSSALNLWFAGTPAASHGAVATGTVYSVLAAGVPIGPASTFSASTTAADYANWRLTNTGQYLGLRFWNESTSAINYGWIQMDTVGPNGAPTTINGYCYQDDGTAIDAGSTTPVELQSFSVE